MADKRVRVKLPAIKVREMANGNGEVENYVREILPLIEEDIENALENEETHAMTEINTIFDVPYMKNSNAQRDVYYLMCQVLIKAGYYPELIFQGKKAENQRVFVVTRWKSHKEDEANDYKTHFLKQITRPAKRN